MTQTTQQPSTDEEKARLQRAHKRADDIRGFYVHLLVYLTVNAGLVVLDAVLGDGWWFYWVAIPWGMCVAAQGVAVFAGRYFGSEWEQRKVAKYLREDEAHRR